MHAADNYSPSKSGWRELSTRFGTGFRGGWGLWNNCSPIARAKEDCRLAGAVSASRDAGAQWVVGLPRWSSLLPLTDAHDSCVN